MSLLFEEYLQGILVVALSKATLARSLLLLAGNPLCAWHVTLLLHAVGKQAAVEEEL